MLRRFQGAEWIDGANLGLCAGRFTPDFDMAGFQFG
jgi:hypothetical protein